MVTMDATDNLTRKMRKEEYQVQLFGFSSSRFTYEAKELIMSVIEESADKLKKSLIQKYPKKGADEIETAMQTLIREYANQMNDWTASFHEKMDRIMCIPSNVLLEEDKPQRKQFSEEDVKKVDEDIEVLKRKLIHAKFMEKKLRSAVASSQKCVKRKSEKPVLDTDTLPTSDLMKKISTLAHKRRKFDEMGDVVWSAYENKLSEQLAGHSAVEVAWNENRDKNCDTDLQVKPTVISS